MEATESTWVQQARAGDRIAFSSLVESYQKPVYNLAYRMLGSVAEAEDATQESFIRAYTRLHTYDPARKFSSWLLAIASHYCIDQLRKRRIQTLPLDDLPPRIELSMPATTLPEQVVVRRQNESAVQALLSVLAPAYRTPLILRYWYDMSYREIAETMDLNEGTVKTRLYRARNKLARHLSSTASNAHHTLPEQPQERTRVERAA
jgi:RNA polymerase sigma-70 factor (ECF subfamily)